MSKTLINEAFPDMLAEFKKAQQLAEKGDLIETEAIYLEMLNKVDNYPPALYGLSELANKINDQVVREDLLRRAIAQVKRSDEPNKKSLQAIWLTELAEVMLQQGRQEDAKQFISESERIIKQNLA